MTEHPAQVMRRAAARLRGAAGEATPGPWGVSFLDGVTPVVDGPGPGDLVAEMQQQRMDRAKADAELIVLLRNSAEALAGWLESEAVRSERDVQGGPVAWWHRGCAYLGSGCDCWDAALSTARAILGEVP